jgi:flagellar protein FlaJ
MYKIKIFGKRIKITNEDIAIVVGVILGIIVLAYGVIVDIYAPWFLNYIFYAILVGVLPYIGYQYFKILTIKNKEEHFPRFLKDLADAIRSGQPLPVAVQNCVKTDYGKLSEDIKQLEIDISWGMSFEDAFQKMGKRIGSKLIERGIGIAIQAHKAGGDIANVLETVAEDIKKTVQLEEERKSKTHKFVIVIYAIFLLFMAIIIVLTNFLIPELPVIGAIQQFIGQGGGLNLTEIEFRNMIFHLSLIEAIANGIMCGIVSEGRIEAGVKHVVILTLIAIISFNVFSPSPDPIDRIAKAIARLPLGAEMSVPVGEYYVTKDLSVKDIIRVLKEKAKESFIDINKLTIDKIKFVKAQTCIPCAQGWIKISRDGTVIELNRPCVLKFILKKSGEIYYVSVE